MLYDFKCKECGYEQAEVFSMSDYDKRVTEDGRLKRKKCEECGTVSLYRHIIKAPDALGGSKNYISMERWQRKHPEHYKRKEAQLEQKMADRHRKRVLDKLDKQIGGGKRDKRHKDYGQDQNEEKLSND